MTTKPTCRKAMKACEKLMDQLSRRLSNDDFALVQALRSQTTIAQCEESERYFKYGFSAGLTVQQEANEQLKSKVKRI